MQLAEAVKWLDKIALDQVNIEIEPTKVREDGVDSVMWFVQLVTSEGIFRGYKPTFLESVIEAKTKAGL